MDLSGLFNRDTVLKKTPRNDEGWGMLLRGMFGTDESGQLIPETDYVKRKKGEVLHSLLRMKVPRGRLPAKSREFFSYLKAQDLELSDKELFCRAAVIMEKKVLKPLLLDLKGKGVCEVRQLLGGYLPHGVSVREPEKTERRIADAKTKGTGSGIVLTFEGDRKPEYMLLEKRLTAGQRGKLWGYSITNCVMLCDTVVFARYALVSFLYGLFHGLVSELEEDAVQNLVVREYYEYVYHILTGLTGADAVSDIGWHRSIGEIMQGILHTGKKVCGVSESRLQRMYVPELLNSSTGSCLHPFGEANYPVTYVGLLGGLHYSVEGHYGRLLRLLFRQWLMERNIDLYQTELRTSAKVWQTKKNIPDKVIREMERSGFLKYFRYVEIDEECDLSKIEEIEKEFVALKNACFGDERYDAELRFRKLGRHHASGLYFPTLKCLCVDIRTPSSFGHEYLHMYDSFHGELSSMYDFKLIRDRYEEILDKIVQEMPEEDERKHRLKGSGKFNLNYYLIPTEVFARCGEIYFTRIAGVNNSLMQPDNGFGYPDDEKLLSLIRDYYGSLFNKKEEKEGLISVLQEKKDEKNIREKYAGKPGARDL